VSKFGGLQPAESRAFGWTCSAFSQTIANAVAASMLVPVEPGHAISPRVGLAAVETVKKVLAGLCTAVIVLALAALVIGGTRLDPQERSALIGLVLLLAVGAVIFSLGLLWSRQKGCSGSWNAFRFARTSPRT